MRQTPSLKYGVLMAALICQTLVCRTLAAQSVAHRTPAGNDPQGNRLTVIQQHYRRREPAAKGCTPGEKFLLEKARNGKRVASEELIVFCQSEADDADTSVTIAPNSISVDRNGGAHAGFWDSTTYQLSPWKTLSSDACSFSAGSTDFTIEHWDFARLKGQAWKGSSEDAGGICVEDKDVFTYAVVPELPFDLARLEQSHARLGSCALSLDASGKNGLVIWGRPDARDPVEVKLLMGKPYTLIAQVIDPQRNTRPAASWVNADHFEIWMSAPGDSAWQFGIPVDEGPVQVGFGKPAKLPAVRRWRSSLPDGRGATVMSIALPWDPNDFTHRLTVVYSQSRDGRAQKRLIATSPVERGDPDTFGSADSVVRLAGYVQCEIVQGSLELSGGPKKPVEIPLPYGGLDESPGPRKQP